MFSFCLLTTSLLVFGSGISMVSSECNSEVQPDLIGLLVGLLPGPYVSEECLSVTTDDSSTSTSFTCNSDGDSATESTYDNSDCSGTAVNVTDDYTSDYLICDGSTSDCDTKKIKYTVYDGDCDDEELETESYMDGSGDICFLLTTFGISTGYATVDISSSKYTLNLFGITDDTCSSSSSELLVVSNTGCTGNYSISISGANNNNNKPNSLLLFSYLTIVTLVASMISVFA